jgi:hypothetical protein
MIRRISFATAVLTLLLGGAAQAQVATVPDFTHDALQTMQFFGDEGNLKNKTVFTVPPGQSFRVTDLAVTTSGPGVCLVFFPGKTDELRVGPHTTQSFSFLSGPTYGPGQNIEVSNDARIPTGGPNGPCTFAYTVMGYLFEVVPTMASKVKSAN